MYARTSIHVCVGLHTRQLSGVYRILERGINVACKEPSFSSCVHLRHAVAEFLTMQLTHTLAIIICMTLYISSYIVSGKWINRLCMVGIAIK